MLTLQSYRMYILLVYHFDMEYIVAISWIVIMYNDLCSQCTLVSSLEWYEGCSKIALSNDVNLRLVTMSFMDVIFAHYSDAIMSTLTSQITGVSIVYSSDCSGADQIKHHRSGSLAFVRGIHRSPVNSPHKGPVTQKMVPFDDVIVDI